MELFEKLKVSAGIMLLVSIVTRVLQAIIDPAGIFIYYNFLLPEITATNIGELIAGAVVGAIAAFFAMIIAYLLIGVSIVIYLILGTLTILTKDRKTFNIAGSVVTGISIFLGASALIRSMAFNYISFFLVLHFIIYLIVFVIYIYTYIQIRKVS
ncbi:hypothetical protein LCGC14_1795700 [marine sediment metagenome]|uniref:Uncharacterized protein n=1 Tax=marine sediment metagenome TaxID=412755 RepID=A0A0F9HDU7_9ZZZZ|nr:hypothetical protein [archaeon]